METITSAQPAARATVKQEREEFENRLREDLRANLDDLNAMKWAVASGKEAASKKILDVVEMLEGASSNKSKDAENDLVRYMHVARNAILYIYEAVEYREGARMMASTCVMGCGHLPWTSYAAGCHSEEADENTRIGGRIWDVANLLRLNNGCHSRSVALSTVYALKQLAGELAFKEEMLEREVKKISAENQVGEISVLSSQ